LQQIVLQKKLKTRSEAPSNLFFVSKAKNYFQTITIWLLFYFFYVQGGFKILNELMGYYKTIGCL